MRKLRHIEITSILQLDFLPDIFFYIFKNVEYIFTLMPPLPLIYHVQTLYNQFL